MKVLLVHDYPAPVGGAEIGLAHLADGLRTRGHDVRRFTSRAGLDTTTGRPEYLCAGTTSRWRTLLQTANPSARRTVRRALHEFRPDVVHVRMFLTQLSPAILEPLCAVPAVLDIAWYRPVCPTGLKLLPDNRPCGVRWGAPCRRNGCLPLRDWLPLELQMRWWHSRRDAFDAVVAHSEAVAQLLAADGIRPVTVVWPGVAERAPRPPLPANPVVAYAGRLVREKGVDVLLDAFAEVRAARPSATLLIVGDGPDRDRLVAESGARGLSTCVTFTGHLPAAEMEEQLGRAWVQAVPSRWVEPFGLVAVEAMMRGTAVVAAATGGLAEIVEDGETGCLVPPADARALARVLIVLLGDRNRAERLGRAGRRRALASFTSSAFVDRMQALYQRLIEARSLAS
jgi:glycosyltransferase involved in cell wall biosynthesis